MTEKRCDICNSTDKVGTRLKTFVVFNFGTDEGYVSDKDFDLCQTCKEIYEFWIAQGIVAIAEGDSADKNIGIKYKLRQDWLYLSHKMNLHKKRGWQIEDENLTRKKAFLDNASDMPMYGIFQLKNESRLRDYRFADYNALINSGKKVELGNYDFLYAVTMDGDTVKLEEIYKIFNLDHPSDFTGHSLSIGDVVVYKYGDNNYAAHYVDTFGFKRLPKFMSGK